MPFYKKFKPLLDIELPDVEIPHRVLLTYAVCACEKDACGWGGWMIEAVERKIENIGSQSGFEEKFVSSFNEQICPCCGKPTFRTGASIIFENPQPYVKEDPIPYETEPILYEEDLEQKLFKKFVKDWKLRNNIKRVPKSTKDKLYQTEWRGVKEGLMAEWHRVHG